MDKDIASAKVTGREAEGTARLIEKADGTIVLRFEDYKVASAPDVHIYLTPDAGGNIEVDGAIDFGLLEQFEGDIEYTLPRDVDVSSFNMVVAYCYLYSVEFGKGTLS